MDPQRPHPSEAPTPVHTEGSTTATAVASTTEPASAPRRLDNPLQAIFGAVIVFLLGFALTQTNDRISRLEDRVDTGFARIDERFTQVDERFTQIDQRFTQIDERFSAQDERLHEINLKLTALIAALNATAEVEAALDGRLLDSNTTPTDEPAN